MLNELNKGLKPEDGMGMITEAFIVFCDYMIIHFSTEEIIIKQYELPHFTTGIMRLKLIGYEKFIRYREHFFCFIDKIREIKRKLLNGMAKIDMAMLDFLRDWLQEHILMVKMCLKNPAQA